MLFHFTLQSITTPLPLSYSWVEEDPIEILNSVKECIEKATENLESLEISPRSIKGMTCNVKFRLSLVKNVMLKTRRFKKMYSFKS